MWRWKWQWTLMEVTSRDETGSALNVEMMMILVLLFFRISCGMN